MARSVDVSTSGPQTWRVVVPVKGTAAAKSRLSLVAGRRRYDLAVALALDTIAAAADTPGVRLVVVTSDGLIAAEAEGLGAAVVPDPGTGLGAAIDAGVEQAARDGTAGVAVLLGDLPALRPADLAAALAACRRAGTAFVPDADGDGTVLLAATEPAWLRPAFGPGSAHAHAAHAARLDLDLPRLRRDADVAADLARAARLGVGARTAALLRAAPDLMDTAAPGDPRPA